MAIPVLTEELRRRFRADLASARAAAAADAEGFDRVITTVEGIGARLSGVEHGLHRVKDVLRALVRAEDVDEFHRVFEVVREARNHAVHTGAAARHLTVNCVRLALIIESGLRDYADRGRSSWLVGDVMVSPAIQVHPWESVRDARIRMLENAFSYLPMPHAGDWSLVSDLAVARWLLGPKALDGRASMTFTMGEVAVAMPALVSLRPALLHPDTKIPEAISEMERSRLPALVVSDPTTTEGRLRLLGVITPFDCL